MHIGTAINNATISTIINMVELASKILESILHVFPVNPLDRNTLILIYLIEKNIKIYYR